MVLSSFHHELSATVPAPLHWADYVEPMQYSGLGVFRAPKLKPTLASADFFPSSNRAVFDESRSDDLVEQSEPLLALVNGPDGWQWAKLPNTFDVMAALKSGQSLFHDQVADDHQPVHEQVDDGMADPQASDVAFPQHDDSRVDDEMADLQASDDAFPQHDDSFYDTSASLHSHANMLSNYAGTNEATIHEPSLQQRLHDENAMPTLPIRLCDSIPESRAHNYSYTDHFINGDFASREVATHCVGGVCHSISQHVFPEATGLMSNAGAAVNDTWTPTPTKTGVRVGTALRRAFSDMSQWLTNGLQENCGGQHREHASPRSFSRGYIFSSANGDAQVDEQETHCRDGHCVKVVRHLVPRPPQYAELDAGNLSRPWERPDMDSDEGPPITATSGEALTPLQPNEFMLPRVIQSMI